MKNVLGHDIPIDTPEALCAFYDRHDGAFPDVQDPRHWDKDQVPGKDAAFVRLLEWARHVRPSSILDVGADWGKYTWKAWQALRPDVVCCIEVSPKKVLHLMGVLDAHKITGVSLLANAEVEALPHGRLVFAMDVVEHFVDWRAGWKNLLQSGEYVYTLVPAGRSFCWSEDHLHIFEDQDIDELCGMATQVIWRTIVPFNAENSWYSILVKA